MSSMLNLFNINTAACAREPEELRSVLTRQTNSYAWSLTGGAYAAL